MPGRVAIIGLVYVLMAIWFLPGYLQRNANLFTGLILAPFICTVDTTRFSLRHLFPALLFLILAVLAPVNTLFFIAMLFSALLFVENSFGKLSDSFLFLLFLISPVFKYLSSVVDFPVRLWLTGQIAALLSSTGVPAVAAGNQIQLANCDFSVDPACAGLNMLVITLILCLFILMHFQRQTGRRLPFIYLAGLFLATIGLNVVCNFFRILVLVGFKIMPGTFFHDFVGIACLIIYVIVPLVTGIKPLLNRWGKTKAEGKPATAVHSFNVVRYPALHAVFIVTLLFIMLHLVNADTLLSRGKDIKLPGFSKYRMANGITKFYNKDALIYLKPTAFYAPEHDPKICWTGSGYQFTNIKKEKLNGIEIYTGTLQKGNDNIYAAWWFDNGETETVNQFKWRWAAAKGEHPFYLINVNTSNRESLLKEASEVLGNKGMLR